MQQVCRNCHRRFDGSGAFCSWNCEMDYARKQQHDTEMEQNAQYQSYLAEEQLKQQQEAAEEQRLHNARIQQQINDERNVRGLVKYFEFYKDHPITLNDFPRIRSDYQTAWNYVNGTGYTYDIQAEALKLKQILLDIEGKYRPVVEEFEKYERAAWTKYNEELEKENEKRRQIEKEQQEAQQRQAEAQKQAEEQRQRKIEIAKSQYWDANKWKIRTINLLRMFGAAILFFAVEFLSYYLFYKKGINIKTWLILFIASACFGFLVGISQKNLEKGGILAIFSPLGFHGVFLTLSCFYRVYAGEWTNVLININKIEFIIIGAIIALSISILTFSQISIIPSILLSSLISYGYIIRLINKNSFGLIYIIFILISIFLICIGSEGLKDLFETTGDNDAFYGILAFPIFAVLILLIFNIILRIFHAPILVKYIGDFCLILAFGVFCGILTKSIIKPKIWKRNF